MKLFDKNYLGHSFIHNEMFHPSNIANNYDWKCSVCGCLCLFARTATTDEVYYLRFGYMNYSKNNVINDMCVINFTCDEYFIKTLLE